MVLKYLTIGTTFLVASYYSPIFNKILFSQKILDNPIYNYGIPHVFFVFSMLMGNSKTPFPFYFVFPFVTFAGITLLDKYYLKK